MGQLQNCHICIIEIPDGVEKEEIFEVITENNTTLLINYTPI